ncbi:MAG TPA: indolepyruvate ferredoxin oxidoreductase family protein, partial [Pseudomonas sp.]|nr:indolepyruvate ferredoxin oxidoreductase family protein [Pseudomonas sp.]
RLAVVDPQAVQQAAGLVRNRHTDTESTPGPLHPLPPGEWEGNEWGATAAPRNTGDERELRGLPSHGGDVAFLPLDDARMSRPLDEMIERRAAFLVEYQDAAYANRYRSLVDRVRAAEADRIGGSTALTETVARYLFKLMAYKDEYEVARLYTSGDFQRRLQQQFEGDYQLRFHLAPPLFARKDEQGRLLKKEYGPWMFKAFGLLAKLKFLRGGRFDVFGRTEERRMERKLIGDYEATVQLLLDGLEDDRLSLAVEIASVPEHIRGFGHVKEAHFEQAKAREAALLAQWRNPKALHIVQVA